MLIKLTDTTSQPGARLIYLSVVPLLMCLQKKKEENYDRRRQYCGWFTSATVRPLCAALLFRFLMCVPRFIKQNQNRNEHWTQAEQRAASRETGKLKLKKNEGGRNGIRLLPANVPFFHCTFNTFVSSNNNNNTQTMFSLSLCVCFNRKLGERDTHLFPPFPPLLLLLLTLSTRVFGCKQMELDWEKKKKKKQKLAMALVFRAHSCCCLAQFYLSCGGQTQLSWKRGGGGGRGGGGTAWFERIHNTREK